MYHFLIWINLAKITTYCSLTPLCITTFNCGTTPQKRIVSSVAFLWWYNWGKYSTIPTRHVLEMKIFLYILRTSLSEVTQWIQSMYIPQKVGNRNQLTTKLAGIKFSNFLWAHLGRIEETTVETFRRKFWEISLKFHETYEKFHNCRYWEYNAVI